MVEDVGEVWGGGGGGGEKGGVGMVVEGTKEER